MPMAAFLAGPGCKGMVGLRRSGLDAVFESDIFTPFDFLFASHKNVETRREMLDAFETRSWD